MTTRGRAGLVFLIVVVAVAATVSRLTWAAPPPAGPTMRILFIGNSLTATNDLPAFIAAIGRAATHPKVEYKTFAPDGVSLEDNWKIGRARKALANERWDVLVMQQGPSALLDSRAHLCSWTARIAAAARARGVRPYLLMVWSAGRFGLPEVIDSYAAAAAEAKVGLLPAGAAWGAAWRRKPRLQLHGRDGFHPSRLGTYLAALVVYARLRDVSPLGLPVSVVVKKKRYTVPPGTASLVRESAAEALTAQIPPPACR
jgi:hypothetical protein